MIAFFVRGLARPQGNHRTGQRADGSLYTYDSTRGLDAWREAIAIEALAARRLAKKQCADGPVELDVTFHLPRPQRLRDKTPPHTTKPDVSKLVRAVEDALTGVLYADDARIVQLTCSKRYAAPGDLTGVSITCRELETVQEAKHP